MGMCDGMGMDRYARGWMKQANDCSPCATYHRTYLYLTPAAAADLTADDVSAVLLLISHRSPLPPMDLYAPTASCCCCGLCYPSTYLDYL